MLGIVLLPTGEEKKLSTIKAIDHTIESLLELGIERAVVSVGHLGDFLSRKYGNKVVPIKAKRQTPGNLSSLLCARELCKGESLLITNADRIFSSPLFFYEEILNNTGSGEIVLAGHRKNKEGEIKENEIKVVVSPWNSLVVACKNLKHYHGAYVGTCVVPAGLSIPFFRKAEDLSRFPHFCVEDLFYFFPARVVWLDRHKFYKIDTFEDTLPEASRG